MKGKERIKCVLKHEEPDMVPIYDSPWVATVERWQKEGMPKDADYVKYFGLDKLIRFYPDVSPRYGAKVLEETDTYKICYSDWGVTHKDWKHAASTPQYLDYTVIDKEAWEKAKIRIQPEMNRIPWEDLKKYYKKCRAEGYWIQAHLWFGFDVTHTWVVGTERLLIAFQEDPDWVRDLFGYLLEVNLALWEKVWEEGYHFDSIFWWDDMGYKHNQFFSIKMYRDILKPFHQRAVEWAHAKGIKAHIHSCGDIRPFVPELVEIGVDALNPMEVKAGMDPVAIKKQFGDKLVLHGGMNAAMFEDREATEAEMRRMIPIVKESGGYIFSSDHSIPSNVSFENFKYIIALAKELGKY